MSWDPQQPPSQSQYPSQASYSGFPPAPPAKRFNGLVVAVVSAILVLGVGGGVLIATRPSHSSPSGGSTGDNSLAVSGTASATASASASATPSATGATPAPAGGTTVALPASADGLDLLTDSVGTNEVANVRKGVAAGGSVYDNVLIGAYGPSADGDYRLVLVDQPFTNLDSADQSAFESTSPSSFVSQFTAQVKMKNDVVETSTDPDAAITCGTLIPSGTLSILTCVWDDDAGFGFAYFYTTYYTTSVPDAAKYTDALRAAAESN